MTDFPFGFQPGSGGDFGDLSKVPFFAELQRLMSSSGGPVNWELARQMATAGAGESDRALTAADTSDTADALRLADVWLDPVTSLPSGATAVEAWTRVRWVESTLETWQTLCDPVAARVIDAMKAALPEEVRGQSGPLFDVMSQVGGLMFGMQVGQALGALAGEVLSSTDVGVPLGAAGRAALLPANVAAFGDGLGVPDAEVRLYLAMREAPTTGCSAMCRGCAGTCSTPSTPMRAASTSTSRSSSGRWARSTRPTRRRCRRPSAAGCSSTRTPRSSRRRWPGSS
jgi:hypothetical protein